MDNLTDDNNIQSLEQNSTDKLSPVSPTGKSRVNSWIISALILLFVVILTGSFYIIKIKKPALLTSKNKSQQDVQITEDVNFETIILGETNLNDPQTELLIGDSKNLYKIKLDGSKPVLLNSFDYFVKYVHALNDDKILITVGYTKYTNSGSDANMKGLGWIPTDKIEKYYLINESTNSKDELDEVANQKFLGISNFLTSPERIYTNEASTPDIYSEKYDGKLPLKIGTVLTNTVNNKKMGVSSRDFIPSFDGSYLLNMDYGKGIEPMFVISRDGSKVYDLDIESGWNSIIWIGNNLLFADNEDKALKILINEDGTLTKNPLSVDLSGFENFGQDYLSPDKKHLVLSDRTNGISIINLDTNNIDSIETGKPSSHEWFVFMKWNRKGDKFMYRKDISDLETEIKIYDLTSKKSYTVAKYSKAFSEEVMTADKPKADIWLFDIR